MNSSDRDKFLALANDIESQLTDLETRLRALRVSVAAACSPGEHDIHVSLQSAETAITKAISELEAAISRLGR